MKNIKKRLCLWLASVICIATFGNISSFVYASEGDLNEIYVEEAALRSEAGSSNVNVYVEGTFDEQQAFKVLELVNQARAAQGLPTLKMDATLMEQAMQRAAECSVYYSHTRPNGESCFTILNSQYLMGCAENIATGYGNAAQVMEAWLKSPGHYANIMGQDYVSIGIGCFYQDGVPYWTQLFSVYSGPGAVQKANYVKKAVVAANTSYLGSLSLQYSKSDLKVGETVSPSLKLANLGYGSSVPSMDNIAFQTSDANVASVEQDGTLHALSAGDVVVTAVLGGAVTAQFSVRVTANPPQLGDVDGDGKVNLADAYMTLKAVMGAATLNENQKWAADIDGEDGVSLSDVQMLLRRVLKLTQ